MSTGLVYFCWSVIPYQSFQIQKALRTESWFLTHLQFHPTNGLKLCLHHLISLQILTHLLWSGLPHTSLGWCAGYGIYTSEKLSSESQPMCTEQGILRNLTAQPPHFCHWSMWRAANPLRNWEPGTGQFIFALNCLSNRKRRCARGLDRGL